MDAIGAGTPMWSLGKALKNPEDVKTKPLFGQSWVCLNDVIVSETTVALAGESFTGLPMKQCSEKCCQKI